MSNARTIVYNVGVQILGKAAITIVSLGLIGIITRTLGVAGYGQYTTAFSYVLFFSVLADLGFFSILTREISRDPSSQYAREATHAILTLRTFIAIAIYLVATVIAFLIPVYPLVVKLSIALLALASFFQTFNSTLVAVFQANLKMDRAVLTDFVGRVMTLLIVLAVAPSGNLLWIIGAYIAGNFANLALSVFLVHRVMPLRISTDTKLMLHLAREAIPLGIVIILVSIYFKVDAVILSLMRSSTDVGIYGAAYKILEVLSLIPTIFVGTIFPVLVRSIEHEPERLRDLVQEAIDALAVMSFPILLGVGVLAPQVIGFVAGHEFVTASTLTLGGVIFTAPYILTILMLSLVFGTFSVLFAHLVVGLKIQRQMILPNIAFVLFNVILNIIFIPHYSYLAAAIITVLTELMVLTTYAWIIGRRLKIKVHAAGVGKALFAGLLMGVVVWFVRGMPLLVPIFLGGALYAVTLWLLGGIPPSLMKLIRRGGA